MICSLHNPHIISNYLLYLLIYLIYVCSSTSQKHTTQESSPCARIFIVSFASEFPVLEQSLIPFRSSRKLWRMKNFPEFLKEGLNLWTFCLYTYDIFFLTIDSASTWQGLCPNHLWILYPAWSLPKVTSLSSCLLMRVSIFLAHLRTQAKRLKLSMSRQALPW